MRSATLHRGRWPSGSRSKPPEGVGFIPPERRRLAGNRLRWEGKAGGEGMEEKRGEMFANVEWELVFALDVWRVGGEGASGGVMTLKWER